MKATYLSLTLALISLVLFTSCGPDANKPTPEVTSITLQKSAATLQTGETLELTATVSPADAKVTFSSSNTAVATVCEKGVVKAIAPGTATITAQAGDKKATCTITVIEGKNVSIFNKLDGKKYPSGSTIDYVTTISEEDAGNCDLDLLFSVIKTMKYKTEITFDNEFDGFICIGECETVNNIKSYKANATEYTADSEKGLIKNKGDMTGGWLHFKLSTPAGETYKNRIVVKLIPEDGSETLSWTINVAITVK
ncbi:Ig-like domain-containing protein [uncultured Porphyromonas sp.]|uniref:Ig-like domain-containing protein n=1 Tax=uncultured Porphyromonas sp. TaxID=159274 RepID=UPI00262AC2EB|nr:Ig-like domain-containing protein [uncultured Porphyromonas sp.]